MSTAGPDASLALRFETAAPVRSPRTSLLLAALARQRRLERFKRRLKRQRRRQARARITAWLDALGRWPLEAMRTRPAPGRRFAGAVPLVYALRPLWPGTCSMGGMTSSPSTAPGKIVDP